jgi:hypothetical protein
MESAGVAAADIAAYLATNGTLTGTDAKTRANNKRKNSSIMVLL